MQELWFDGSATTNSGEEPYTNLFLINLAGTFGFGNCERGSWEVAAIVRSAGAVMQEKEPK